MPAAFPPASSHRNPARKRQQSHRLSSKESNQKSASEGVSWTSSTEAGQLLPQGLSPCQPRVWPHAVSCSAVALVRRAGSQEAPEPGRAQP